jgi:hypothetical protein
MVVGVAQLVERRSVAPNVAGSNPVAHPNPLTHLRRSRLSKLQPIPPIEAPFNIRGLNITVHDPFFVWRL